MCEFPFSLASQNWSGRRLPPLVGLSPPVGDNIFDGMVMRYRSPLTSVCALVPQSASLWCVSFFPFILKNEYSHRVFNSCTIVMVHTFCHPPFQLSRLQSTPQSTLPSGSFSYFCLTFFWCSPFHNFFSFILFCPVFFDLIGDINV